MAAALLPGAAVFASPLDTVECADIDPANLRAQIELTDLIVIGVARSEHGGGLVRIEPEAYLKGAARSEPIRPAYPVSQSAGCSLARFEDGSRVMAFLHVNGGTVAWPQSGEVFWLSDGMAASGGAQPEALPESDLVTRVRDVTGEYAVPATSEDEGQGIEWGSTVLPIAVALGVIFVIGLFLMRIWHRIDPS
jgi:hypothetical protein